MSITRRQYLAGAATAAGALATGLSVEPVLAQSEQNPPKIGMCDWCLRDTTPAALELAKRIGLDGVQVSLGDVKNQMWLRRKEIQHKYLAAAREHGISIASLAIGELNHVPLMSEPRAAVWVADAIPVAAELGVDNILLAFFVKGELKGTNAEDMRRVIEVLAELAPRAEKAGVALGIESYLSAEDHLKIIDAVDSEAVQVYYDLKNTADAGYDPIAAMKQIGVDRICQVHFKDVPCLEEGSGKVDWPAAVAALKQMSYRGWIVLETPSPKDVVADTRKNLDYVRRLFATGA